MSGRDAKAPGDEEEDEAEGQSNVFPHPCAGVVFGPRVARLNTWCHEHQQECND